MNEIQSMIEDVEYFVNRNKIDNAIILLQAIQVYLNARDL